MQPRYIKDLSFVATLNVINTQAPGPVHTWEQAGRRDDGSFIGRDGSWLTSTQAFAKRGPQPFWFGAVSRGVGFTRYELRLWGENAGAARNVRAEFSDSGYLGLYPLTDAVTPAIYLYEYDTYVHMTDARGQFVRVGFETSSLTGYSGDYLNLQKGIIAQFSLNVIEKGVAEPGV